MPASAAGAACVARGRAASRGANVPCGAAGFSAPGGRRLLARGERGRRTCAARRGRRHLGPSPLLLTTDASRA